jgi:hypothetical protein
MRKTFDKIFDVIPEGMVVVDEFGHELRRNLALTDRVLKGAPAEEVSVLVDEHEEALHEEQGDGIVRKTEELSF